MAWDEGSCTPPLLCLASKTWISGAHLRNRGIAGQLAGEPCQERDWRDHRGGCSWPQNDHNSRKAAPVLGCRGVRRENRHAHDPARVRRGPYVIEAEKTAAQARCRGPVHERLRGEGYGTPPATCSRFVHSFVAMRSSASAGVRIGMERYCLSESRSSSPEMTRSA